ncbi:MAG: DUF4349 domain-containing protein [Lachnospiraceae bacterium]|nr:DUF4349 domain-containing protein [bacterium]MDY5517587.1 DUF4349 domain-containing protein [Lachnospiraceae bacterium]
MKKKMKTNRTRKMSILLLAMLLAFTLSGCGASSKNFEAAADSAAPEEMKEAEYEVTEDAVAEDDAMDTGMMDEAAGAGEVQAETVQSNEKIIYTYNYSVETKQFDTFMDVVQKRINEYGGYLESSETNGNQEMNILRYANMVIRIPADKMHSFLDMVKENSNVTYSSSSTENVTLSYVDMQSHIKALKTEQETLMGILERAEKLKDIITIQNQLTNIRYELESYESQLRVYDNRINYSTLYLDINEVERETNVATELTYGEEIRRGLSDTMYDIGQGLRSFSIWFIVNLPILLIWAVVLVIIVLISRALFKAGAKRAARREASRRGASDQVGTGGSWTAQTEKKQTEQDGTDSNK